MSAAGYFKTQPEGWAEQFYFFVDTDESRDAALEDAMALGGIVAVDRRYTDMPKHVRVVGVVHPEDARTIRRKELDALKVEVVATPITSEEAAAHFAEDIAAQMEREFGK